MVTWALLHTVSNCSYRVGTVSQDPLLFWAGIVHAGWYCLQDPVLFLEQYSMRWECSSTGFREGGGMGMFIYRVLREGEGSPTLVV
jgi:hypothetical protein